MGGGGRLCLFNDNSTNDIFSACNVNGKDYLESETVVTVTDGPSSGIGTNLMVVCSREGMRGFSSIGATHDDSLATGRTAVNPMITFWWEEV